MQKYELIINIHSTNFAKVLKRWLRLFLGIRRGSHRNILYENTVLDVMGKAQQVK